MIVTNERIEVTYQMMVNNDMTRGEMFGIPVDPKNPSMGLHWKFFKELQEEDYDNLELYFLLK